MTRTKLTGWKEIATYLHQSVRTVQRWEQRLKLPVHRFAEVENTPVFAFVDELDSWLARTHIKERPYVRPVLLVADAPEDTSISSRKLALEMSKYNVLTSFTAAEVLATVARFDVDAVVIETELFKHGCEELLQNLKQTYPSLMLIGVFHDEEQLRNISCAHLMDHTLTTLSTDALVSKVEELLGVARIQ